MISSEKQSKMIYESNYFILHSGYIVHLKISQQWRQNLYACEEK